ncbi:MAG: Fe-Mn family superoxide dismutase [Desulfotomaculaceae bacterium]|nr:Fe-Mn family superoxide dismutase [Desulfotomaculaceae bacterium]
MDEESLLDIYDGFPREFLDEHYTRYLADHENKIKEIEARLLKVDMSMANPIYCTLRSLNIEYTHALNSVKLHKYYFENIANKASAPPSTEMLGMLERNFGSPQEWEKQFFALAMCARGWVVLGLDLEEGTLRNYFSDSHAEGVWSVAPLLVLDVYEHAYCTTFPNRRDYIRVFLKNVNWAVVNKRLYNAMNMYNSRTANLSRGGR